MLNLKIKVDKPLKQPLGFTAYCMLKPAWASKVKVALPA